jgi:hypothetical protein
MRGDNRKRILLLLIAHLIVEEKVQVEKEVWFDPSTGIANTVFPRSQKPVVNISYSDFVSNANNS